MRLSQIAVFISFAVVAQMAAAQTTVRATTESRDASLAYTGSANFVVGRIGRDCLSLVDRTESPQAFVGVWQQRNAKYLMASAKYMDIRMAEAEVSGGPGMRDAVMRELMTAVRGSAEAIITSWLNRPDKQEACKRAIALVESGTYDFSATSPMFAELESLVKWAEQP